MSALEASIAAILADEYEPDELLLRAKQATRVIAVSTGLVTDGEVHTATAVCPPSRKIAVDVAPVGKIIGVRKHYGVDRGWDVADVLAEEDYARLYIGKACRGVVVSGRRTTRILSNRDGGGVRPRIYVRYEAGFERTPEDLIEAGAAIAREVVIGEEPPRTLARIKLNVGQVLRSYCG